MSKYFASSEFPWESILCWSLVVEIPLVRMRQCSNIPDKLGGKKTTAHLRLFKTFLAEPVHRLPHQCCLTRLCEHGEKSDWHKLWEEAWSHIYIVNHNVSPTLNLNEDLFLGGISLIELLFIFGGRVKSLLSKLYSTQTFMDTTRSAERFMVNLKSPSKRKLFAMLVC